IPTPAVRATASRLASAPPALKTAFAASRTRSRLRTASARGFRVLSFDGLIPTSNPDRACKTEASSVYQSGLAKRRHPPYIGRDTLTHNTRVEQTATSLISRSPQAGDRRNFAQADRSATP